MHVLSVDTPAGVDLVTKIRVKDGQVVIAGQTIHVDLKVVDMTDFDVILGMDWLDENFASIDCHKKEVIFTPPNGLTFKFKGTFTGTTPKIISMMKARCLVQQGGVGVSSMYSKHKRKEKTNRYSTHSKRIYRRLPGGPPGNPSIVRGRLWNRTGTRNVTHL